MDTLGVLSNSPKESSYADPLGAMEAFSLLPGFVLVSF